MISPVINPRRLLAAAALAGTATLAAACGSQTAGGQSSASATVSAPASASSSAAAPATPSTPAAPSTAAGPGPCATSALSIAVGSSKGGAAAGSVFFPINFTNTSSSSCTMYGYPGVSFVTGQGGSQIGSAAARNTASTAAALVTLAPGQAGHAVLQVVDTGNYSASACKPVTAHWLRVYPPGQYSAAYVPFTSSVCSEKLPASLGHGLGIFVMRSGPGKAGEAP